MQENEDVGMLKKVKSVNKVKSGKRKTKMCIEKRNKRNVENIQSITQKPEYEESFLYKKLMKISLYGG